MILGWLNKIFWRDTENNNDTQKDYTRGLDDFIKANMEPSAITITKINELIDLKKITNQINEDA